MYSELVALLTFGGVLVHRQSMKSKELWCHTPFDPFNSAMYLRLGLLDDLVVKPADT
jgi:hypothetical protein